MGETETVTKIETVEAEGISCEWPDFLDEKPCDTPAVCRVSVACRLCRHACGWINLCPEHVLITKLHRDKRWGYTRCHRCRIGRMTFLKFVRLNNKR